MIICKACVTRNPAARVRRSAFIACREANDRFGVGEDFCGIDSLVGVALKIAHLSVIAVGKPALKFSSVIRCARRRETAIIEPQLSGALLNRGFHYGSTTP